MKDIPGILVLEDGTKFKGSLFGVLACTDKIRKSLSKKDFSYGEVVFNTSMTGYQEILTDPSYFGQLVCMTAPHIGNTGTNQEDPESNKAWCSGFIVHETCESPSHWRSQGNLEDFLISHQIPAIQHVDTRALTRHLRSYGVLRGIILPEHEEKNASTLFKDLPRLETRDLIAEVSTPEPFVWNNTAHNSIYRIVAMDFGIKWNLLRRLEQLGCHIEVVPARTSASTILAKKPQGVFLSNGPGNPNAAPYAVDTVRELLGKIPIFGVCMGHQILGLALGARTYKLKFGHRGGNQPVLVQDTGRVEISSHNHGYAIDGTTLPSGTDVTHINLNDKTVEGIVVKGAQAFSVQYHPEACPGPHDSIELFQKFIHNMSRYVSKIS